MIKKLILSSIFILFSSYTFSAQRSIDEVNEIEHIEEIEVVGKKPLFRLRREVYDAQDQVFSLYNELNKDDEFDITCEMSANIGTLIKRRKCMPNFYRKATADEARQILTGLLAMPVHVVMSRKNPVLKEKMLVLVEENPELSEKLYKWVGLANDYNQIHQERFSRD